MSTIDSTTLAPRGEFAEIPSALGAVLGHREVHRCALSALAAISSVLTTAGIVFVLVGESIRSFGTSRSSSFLTDRYWTPLFDDAHLRHPAAGDRHADDDRHRAGRRHAPRHDHRDLAERVRRAEAREIVKPILEVLSAVPTVVFGYFAVQFISPALQHIFPDLPTFNMLSARG